MKKTELRKIIKESVQEVMESKRDEVIQKLVDEFGKNASSFNNTPTNQQREKFWTLNRLTNLYNDYKSGKEHPKGRRHLKENTIFNTGWDVIGYLDDIPELKKYRNKAASYDDEYYLIPTDVFTQVTGWTEEDVRNINDNLEPYEGNIIWTNTNPNQYQEYTVSVSGGA
jgi:hypothetical protein